MQKDTADFDNFLREAYYFGEGLAIDLIFELNFHCSDVVDHHFCELDEIFVFKKLDKII